MSSAVAVLTVWHAEQGWGVLESAETVGGCWFLFDSLEDLSVDHLKIGQTYALEFEPVEQDGYQYRASKVSPVPGRAHPHHAGRPLTDGVAFRSTLKLDFDQS